MGLSIYYKFKVKTADVTGVRDTVRALRRFVVTLPFDDVSPIEEYAPPDGRYVFERADADADADGRRWKPGGHYLSRKRDDGLTELVPVPAQHVVCFHANLKGSETASFGLASHPPVVVHREDVVTHDEFGIETRQLEAGDPVEVPTRLRGWYSWWSACKTQYAGNPRFGGPANFLRAHLSVFRAVDHARSLGLTTFIRDDGPILAAPRRGQAARVASRARPVDRRIRRAIVRCPGRCSRDRRRADQGPPRLRTPGGGRDGQATPAAEAEVERIVIAVRGGGTIRLGSAVDAAAKLTIRMTSKMLMPAEVIPFLTHGDELVRRQAVMYYRDCADPGPLTADAYWAAIDHFGGIGPATRTFLAHLPGVPQTDASVGRLLDALADCADRDDIYDLRRAVRGTAVPASASPSGRRFGLPRGRR